MFYWRIYYIARCLSNFTRKTRYIGRVTSVAVRRCWPRAYLMNRFRKMKDVRTDRDSQAHRHRDQQRQILTDRERKRNAYPMFKNRRDRSGWGRGSHTRAADPRLAYKVCPCFNAWVPSLYSMKDRVFPVECRKKLIKFFRCFVLVFSTLCVFCIPTNGIQITARHRSVGTSKAY